MDPEITERARAIDAAVGELKQRIEELSGLGPADELAILAGALGRVSSKLARRSEELQSEPPPEPVEERAPETAPGGAAPRSGLAIVATELALSGSSREDVAGYLSDRYGVEDATELLDEVFGAPEPG